MAFAHRAIRRPRTVAGRPLSTARHLSGSLTARARSNVEESTGKGVCMRYAPSQSFNLLAGAGRGTSHAIVAFTMVVRAHPPSLAQS